MEKGGKGLFTLNSLPVFVVYKWHCFSALVGQSLANNEMVEMTMQGFTGNNKIPMGIHTGHQNICAFLKSLSRCLDLDPHAGIQCNQQSAREASVPSGKDHCPCLEHLQEGHPGQCQSQGHGLTWKLPCWVPGGWLKVRSRIPSQQGCTRAPSPREEAVAGNLMLNLCEKPPFPDAREWLRINC